MAPLLRPVLLASLLVAALVGAGCTDRLSLNAATLDDPSFDLAPLKGDKTTVFTVDAKGLAERHNVTWDWGDGTLSYGAKAEHRYRFTNGVMTVTMVVTSDDGRQSVATRPLTLGTGLNTPPTLTLMASRTWVEVGKTVNVSARGSDRDGDPLTYYWTVAPAEAAPGEERVVEAQGAKAALVFDAPGSYLVRVRALDVKGADAAANLTLRVSTKIPSSVFEATFNGTLVAGTGGAAASEKAWVEPAPDTNVDAARHRFTLDYPGYAIAVLTWNDTSTQGIFDLDLELRAANGTTMFRSETRAPAAPFEFNMSRLDAGDYDLIVRGVTGANVAYTLLVQASLQVTPELVAKRDGGATG